MPSSHSSPLPAKTLITSVTAVELVPGMTVSPAQNPWRSFGKVLAVKAFTNDAGARLLHVTFKRTAASGSTRTEDVAYAPDARFFLSKPV